MRANISPTDKIDQCNEFYCSICQDKTFTTQKQAEKCFNSHKVKPGSIIKEPCKCNDCDGNVTIFIPQEKFIVDNVFVCKYCETEYENIVEAESCFDAHFIEGQCLICGKDSIAIVSDMEHDSFKKIVNAKVIQLCSLDFGKGWNNYCSIICLDCLKKKQKEIVKFTKKLDECEELDQ